MKDRARACPECQKVEEPTETARLRLALDRLERQHVELANRVAEYMSEAGLDRAVRTERALETAAALIRIVGGRPTPRGSYPDCCLIGQGNPNGSQVWYCTGVLIHPRVVLTAGHCHDSRQGLKPSLVALGAEKQTELGHAEIVSVKRAAVHPEYATTGFHDLCVLVLRRAAGTAPVAIATAAELKAATRTTLVGFGNNDLASSRGFGIKREVEVSIKHIRRRKEDDLDAAEERLGFESDLEFVAGGDGFDSCNGDSGGPAYIGSKTKRRVAGITSRATDTARNPCGDGGIYTRLDVHLPFIQRVAKDAGVAL